MNRVNFGQLSGVVVDVCRQHGVWFDVGEINAVVDFVATGGLDRANEHAARMRAAEKERLRARWMDEHKASASVGLFGRGDLPAPGDSLRYLGRAGERALLRALFDWLRVP
jgi:Zn-finger nucleic acid-binding protein